MWIIWTSLQADNHASTSSLSFYTPDVLPAAVQPTVSKHWRHCLAVLYLRYLYSILRHQRADVKWLISLSSGVRGLRMDAMQWLTSGRASAWKLDKTHQVNRIAMISWAILLKCLLETVWKAPGNLFGWICSHPHQLTLVSPENSR